MNPTADKTTADYYGLQVEIISQMEHCCLIRFQGRELIVDSADLVFARSLQKAA